MSDPDVGTRARQAALRAAELNIDQWEHTEGSAVVGWVLVVETMRPNGSLDVTYLSGNGDPITEDGGAGIASHRLEALLREALRQLDHGMRESYE